MRSEQHATHVGSECKDKGQLTFGVGMLPPVGRALKHASRWVGQPRYCTAVVALKLAAIILSIWRAVVRH